MIKKRHLPTPEELEDAKKYRAEFRKRMITNKFVAYMLGYSNTYTTALLNGIDPLSSNAREGFNYIIDIVDSYKKIKNY